jgi:hypothetical protein
MAVNLHLLDLITDDFLHPVRVFHELEGNRLKVDITPEAERPVETIIGAYLPLVDGRSQPTSTTW